MENNAVDNSGKKETGNILKFNLTGVGLMVLCTLSENVALAAFLFGLILGLINFILMIVFILHKKPFAYMTCLISMLLLPIIGFGCCTAGIHSFKI